MEKDGASQSPTDSSNRSSAALQPPPALPDASTRWALFLDVDGTLLDIAPTPDAVVVTPQLRASLHQLHAALEGALALISGRSLADLDALFDPLQLPAAGLHGAEWRDNAGTHEIPFDSTAIAQMRAEAAALAAGLPGVRFEDKGRGVALHWRQAPAAEAALRAGTALIAERTGLAVQPGKCVFELKPRGVDKGIALQRLLSTPPFHGRRPLFIGDDLTDGFAVTAVQACDGVAIRVGDTLAAMTTAAFTAPADVRHWLQAWGAQLAARPFVDDAQQEGAGQEGPRQKDAEYTRLQHPRKHPSLSQR